MVTTFEVVTIYMTPEFILGWARGPRIGRETPFIEGRAVKNDTPHFHYPALSVDL